METSKSCTGLTLINSVPIAWCPLHQAIGMTDIWLLVFGGTLDGAIFLDAFGIGFSKAANLSAWAKVGACPFTRACLTDEKVRLGFGCRTGITAGAA